jgi:hypothetical protein
LEQLEELGERHAECFGVTAKHYPIFGEALLNTLELLLLDRQWQKSTVRVAWLDLWRIMSTTMLRGARKVVRRRKKEKQRLERQRLLLEEEGPADLTESPESSSSLTSTSLTSTSLTDSPPSHNTRDSSSLLTTNKSRSMRALMMAPGHGMSSSYLNLSDDEQLGFIQPVKPISTIVEKKKKSKKTKKKSKKSNDLLLDEESSDHHEEEPRKLSSLNAIVCLDDDDESSKASCFNSLGLGKTKSSRKPPRPGMTRAASWCRVVSSSSSKTTTMMDNQQAPSTPRRGMVKRVASFRLRKREQVID